MVLRSFLFNGFILLSLALFSQGCSTSKEVKEVDTQKQETWASGFASFVKSQSELRKNKQAE